MSTMKASFLLPNALDYAKVWIFCESYKFIMAHKRKKNGVNPSLITSL